MRKKEIDIFIVRLRNKKDGIIRASGQCFVYEDDGVCYNYSHCLDVHEHNNPWDMCLEGLAICGVIPLSYSEESARPILERSTLSKLGWKINFYDLGVHSEKIAEAFGQPEIQNSRNSEQSETEADVLPDGTAEFIDNRFGKKS